MPPRTKTQSSRPSLSQSALQTMEQFSHPRHTSLLTGVSNMTSRPFKDDELSNQDSFSLCSRAHQGHGTPREMNQYWTSDILDNGAILPTEPESPAVQMSFSMSQQYMPSTSGHDDLMYHTVSEFPAVQDVIAHSDLDYTHAQDFHSYSPLVDLVFDNDACPQSGSRKYPDDALSLGCSSQAEDKQIMGAGDWNSFHGSPLDQLSSTLFQPVPVSPPLTEASNDICVTSSCSSSGYTSFMANDDVLFADVTTPIGNQGISLGDPLFPITPPLTEHDPNRTVRPSKQARRPALSAAATDSKAKPNQEIFQSLPVREAPRQRSKDGAELKNPRDHPYYSMPTHSDGKYYCPFATGDKPCNHPPTTQKCAYHKYLDSHLKPYRCKVPACMDAQLQFSSNACLFRHEREAHGLHGHGDNPHLCLFEGCERSIPGYGFPRRWNLYDHMRRVHDYTSSEQPSSPENSPSVGQATKRKETTGRKRRVSGVTGGQVMKRSRSNQSQKTSAKATTTTHSSAHNAQRLRNAEKNYFTCRARLLDELSHITPQDSAMHEKVNASLQELITLGLNYRHIEASQVAAQVSHGLPA